jgi:hypothetical protein
MWSNSQVDDDKEVNELMDVVDRHIADLTETCEPILTWDGASLNFCPCRPAVQNFQPFRLSYSSKFSLILLQEFVDLFKLKMKIM